MCNHTKKKLPSKEIRQRFKAHTALTLALQYKVVATKASIIALDFDFKTARSNAWEGQVAARRDWEGLKTRRGHERERVRRCQRESGKTSPETPSRHPVRRETLRGIHELPHRAPGFHDRDLRSRFPCLIFGLI